MLRESSSFNSMLNPQCYIACSNAKNKDGGRFTCFNYLGVQLAGYVSKSWGKGCPGYEINKEIR